MYLHSVNAYADEIVDGIDKESSDYLKTLENESELVCLHHSWGRSIRNEYGLWDKDHPLTKNWHEFPNNRNIIDGVDYSNDHPDAISTEIMKLVYKKITA